MKRRKPQKPVDLGPTFPVGSEVVILRPNLWSGCRGHVEQMNDDGTHRVRIIAKDRGTYPQGFRADVPGSQLEYDL